MNSVPWYAILLLIAFYFLVCIEFMIPTAGMAGFAAAASIVSALVIAFSFSIYWGVTLSAVVIVTTPPLMISLVRIWPHTPIGRRILNRRPGDPLYEPTVPTTRSGRDYQSLIGCIGETKSDLLPTGIVRIDQENHEAVSTGGVIDRGSSVVVTGAQRRLIQVRIANADDLKRASIDGAAEQSAEHALPEEPSIEHSQSTPSSSQTVQSPPALEWALDDLADPDGKIDPRDDS
jgi:membrane-bound ClpP family serine protease